MNAFTAEREGAIRLYGSAAEILEEFYPVRLELYARRKRAMEGELARQLRLVRDKARFIAAVMAGEIELAAGKLSQAELEDRLVRDGYGAGEEEIAGMGSVEGRDGEGGEEERAEERMEMAAEGSAEVRRQRANLQPLLSMPLSSLTRERIQRLESDRQGLEERLTALQAQRPAGLWREELLALRAQLEKDPLMVVGKPVVRRRRNAKRRQR